jgi:hypothetical protein
MVGKTPHLRADMHAHSLHFNLSRLTAGQIFEAPGLPLEPHKITTLRRSLTRIEASLFRALAATTWRPQDLHHHNRSFHKMNLECILAMEAPQEALVAGQPWWRHSYRIGLFWRHLHTNQLFPRSQSLYILIQSRVCTNLRGG